MDEIFPAVWCLGGACVGYDMKRSFRNSRCRMI